MNCKGCVFGVSLVHEPSRVFSGSDRATLVEKLTEVAQDGFGTSIAESDVENHVLPVSRLYLIDVGGSVVGFSSYDCLNFLGKSILYLSGTVIKREFQKCGFFRMVNSLALMSGNYDFFAMRTQNPVVYAAASKLVDLYPKIESPPDDVKDIACLIAEEHLGMKNYCHETFVGRSTYGCCLYDAVPEHHAKGFFDKVLGLNYNSGDSVILVGRVENVSRRL